VLQINDGDGINEKSATEAPSSHSIYVRRTLDDY